MSPLLTTRLQTASKSGDVLDIKMDAHGLKNAGITAFLCLYLVYGVIPHCDRMEQLCVIAVALTTMTLTHTEVASAHFPVSTFYGVGWTLKVTVSVCV